MEEERAGGGRERERAREGEEEREGEGVHSKVPDRGRAALCPAAFSLDQRHGLQRVHSQLAIGGIARLESGGK